MGLSSEEAFELSKLLRNLSVSIGDYRFEKYKTLSEEKRKTLEDAEYTLINLSSEMITTAVGLVLEETQWSFERLKKLTESANETLKKMAAVRTAIEVAAAAVSLATAIQTKDVNAIGKNAKALYETIHHDQN